MQWRVKDWRENCPPMQPLVEFSMEQKAPRAESALVSVVASKLNLFLSCSIIGLPRTTDSLSCYIESIVHYLPIQGNRPGEPCAPFLSTFFPFWCHEAGLQPPSTHDSPSVLWGIRGCALQTGSRELRSNVSRICGTGRHAEGLTCRAEHLQCEREHGITRGEWEQGGKTTACTARFPHISNNLTEERDLFNLFLQSTYNGRQKWMHSPGYLPQK